MRAEPVILPPSHQKLITCSTISGCLHARAQGVATELTRDAYETHARIALEAADLAEFRQCLARLKQLYRTGVSAFE